MGPQTTTIPRHQYTKPGPRCEHCCLATRRQHRGKTRPVQLREALKQHGSQDPNKTKAEIQNGGRGGGVRWVRFGEGVGMG